MCIFLNSFVCLFCRVKRGGPGGDGCPGFPIVFDFFGENVMVGGAAT